VAAAAGAQAPAAPPEAARQALSAAVEALESGDAAAAERHFTRATELAPKLPQAWLGLGEAQQRLGHPQQALEASRRALELAPDLAPAAFAVGRCLAELGSHREALTALERALELDPGRTDTVVLTALVLRRLGRDDDALALLDGTWKKGNRDPLIAEQLAFLRFDSGHPADAATVAREGLAGDPGRANLKLVLGLALANDPAQRAEAARWLEEALAAGVDQPGQVRLALGGVLLDDGRPADAIPHLEEAARLLPNASAPQYRLAQARRATGDEAGEQAALARFQQLEAGEQATDRESKELGVALNGAQSLALENRLTEALAELDRLHAGHPDDPRVNALRAKVLFSMGRRREAEQSIAEASARTPGRAEYQYLEGLFDMYAGRVGDAEAALRRALAIDDGLAEAHALLAGALVKQRKPEEALAHFQRAIELGADSPEVRLGYAGALETLGRKRESDAQMEAYRKLQARPTAADGSHR
jgi:tetratricopeptide (TPR) repeat protein